MKHKQHGGKRKNAGRNPLPAEKRKETIYLYIEKGIIEAHGGEEETKKILYKSLDISE